MLPYRCYICGLPLGQFTRSWLDRLTCVRWHGSQVQIIPDSYRQGVEFRSPLGIYLAGVQEDGWFLFAIHTACYNILRLALQATSSDEMLASVCDFFYSMPFEKLFEASDASLQVEFDGWDIFYHPDPRIINNGQKEYLFANPNALEWRDLNIDQSVKGDIQIVNIFVRQKSDDLRKLPPELLDSIIQHLPTKDVRNLFIVSPAAALLRLTPTFWSHRLMQDLPFIELIKGDLDNGISTETRYKCLSNILRHGIGQAADSLRNLQRIYRQAHQVCHTLQLRELMIPPEVSFENTDHGNPPGVNYVSGPHGSEYVDIPLLENSLYFSSFAINKTRYLSGVRIGSHKACSGYGFHYQETLHVLPNYLSAGKVRMSFCHTNGGYVKLGFTTSNNEEAFIGSTSGISISQSEIAVKKSSIMRLEFDHYKIVSIKVGQPGRLKPLILWQPLPPAICKISPLTPSQFTFANDDFREMCYFGGSNGCHLDKLIQIDSFSIGSGFGISGLEFVYIGGKRIQWGSCFGTRQCRLIDGPGGERIVAMRAASSDVGIVQIRLRTNAHRELVFKSTRRAVPLPSPFEEGFITGFHGYFQEKPDLFTGARFLKAIGCLSEPLETPLFVGKQLYQQPNLELSRQARSTTERLSWESHVSFAPLDNIQTITVMHNEHQRLTGLKFTYSDNRLDMILANFICESKDTQEESLAAHEQIMQVTCHYKMEKLLPGKKFLKGLKFTTNQRVIDFGSKSSAVEDVTFQLDAQLPKGLYWIYNVAFDQLFCNFQ
ncbi:hypothetical protein L228DRAFT_286069 [Xylona heveae TC161]|uniref:F-box domain-containing protein n=1 Tax=Xylona heveae (strain CBS 132557 / TC161) TaxID=1328760 RepID=A0A164ZKP2_XYLHT|nr:hypothetical protein L228DRAFT_286069 [Xylona heveae TC161]KZF19212.1 hypothetical protein L228DRAFT_286069 [Xylona heveae TC161]